MSEGLVTPSGALNIAWQDLYRAALLELKPEEMRRRIGEAQTAIAQRIENLRRDDSSSRDELHQLDDALRGLRLLASTECKPIEQAPSASAANEVAS